MVYATILKCFLALFGGLALLSNVLFLVYTLLLKKKYMFEKLVLVYTIGSAVTGLGYLTSYAIKLSTSCQFHYSTPARCIARSPQLFFFIIGIPMEGMGVSVLNLDRLMATINRGQWKFTNRRFVICVSVIGSIVTALAAGMLSTALYTRGRLISSCCYMESTLPKYYYVLYYAVVLFTGYLNIVLFAVAAIRYWRGKTGPLSSEHFQPGAGKYEAVCMKHTAIICLFGFALQTVPSTISTYAYYNDIDSVIVPNMSAVCIACYCIYPIYRLWTYPFCNRNEVTFLNT